MVVGGVDGEYRGWVGLGGGGFQRVGAPQIAGGLLVLCPGQRGQLSVDQVNEGVPACGSFCPFGECDGGVSWEPLVAIRGSCVCVLSVWRRLFT